MTFAHGPPLRDRRRRRALEGGRRRPGGAALASADPETLTVAFFAREEGRYKAPDKLHKAVEKAGGQIAAEMNVKAWDLPKWVIEQAARPQARPRQGRREGARRPGRRPPAAAAARAREARAGARRRARPSAPRRSRSRARPRPSARSGRSPTRWWRATSRRSLELLLELRQQGERVTGLIWNMVKRLRDAVAVAEALAAGQSPAQVKKTLRMPPRAADKFVKDVATRDVEALRRALAAMADLEVETRGGAGGGAQRGHRRRAGGSRRRRVASRRHVARERESPARLAVSADRGLRLPVGLRDVCARRSQRRDRMDVPAAPRRPERVRRAAGPRRGHVPARPGGHDGPRRPPLRPGHDDPRDLVGAPTAAG